MDLNTKVRDIKQQRWGHQNNNSGDIPWDFLRDMLGYAGIVPEIQFDPQIVPDRDWSSWDNWIVTDSWDSS